MKRSVVWLAVAIMAGVPLLWSVEASARAGRGGSLGSRGSKSYSAPAPAPTRPATPPASTAPAPASRPGMWGGLAGGLAGFALGGLLGSLLFGGLGGGVGVLDLLVLAGLGYLGFLMLRRRPQPALAGPAGQAPAPVDARPAAAAVAVAPPSDLARGIGHIRQMDAGFDPGDLARSASQIFFRIQSAWSAGDLGPVSELLGPELRAALEADLARLRAQGRVNRIENMLIEEAEVVEAWQESGQDFATVRFRASLLDYTLEESGGRVVEGSRTEPVRFEEDWTFTRPVGPSPWRLSAVTQVPAA